MGLFTRRHGDPSSLFTPLEGLKQPTLHIEFFVLVAGLWFRHLIISWHALQHELSKIRRFSHNQGQLS